MDLKDVYPEKEVTLIHSRQQLMPLYPIEMHNGSKRISPLIIRVLIISHGEPQATWDPDGTR
jgi:hypothetical protein